MFTTGAGIVMSLLVAVRGATGGYLVAAEEIGWKWLEDGNPGEDDGGKGKGRSGDETVVLVTVWGEEIIGALAMRVLKREKRAVVRAWTVGLKFRGKGVGKALLEDGVRLAMTEKGCRGVEFDERHASKCIFLMLMGSSTASIDAQAPNCQESHECLTPLSPMLRFKASPARPL